MTMNGTAGLSRALQIVDGMSVSWAFASNDSTSSIPSFVLTVPAGAFIPKSADHANELINIRRRSFSKHSEAWQALANL